MNYTNNYCTNYFSNSICNFFSGTLNYNGVSESHTSGEDAAWNEQTGTVLFNHSLIAVPNLHSTNDNTYSTHSPNDTYSYNTMLNIFKNYKHLSENALTLLNNFYMH